LDLNLLQGGEWHERIAALRPGWAGVHGIMLLSPSDWRATLALFEQVFDQIRDSVPAALFDRAYGIVVHGDRAAENGARRALAAHLERLGMADSDSFGPL